MGRYLGAPAEDCRYLLERLCVWLEDADFTPQPGLELVYAILKAIVAHVYLAWIHPFGDGNGRTARLMEFQILVVAGVPTPAAHLLSNYYNQTRAEYYRQLDAASRSGGNLVAFTEYAVQGFVDALRSQIEMIREQPAYARRSSRVLYRDVTELVRRDLVERTPAGVRAKKELILAFLPWRKQA